jgi:ribonucleoside-diphosphate reductase alpha chain
VLSVSGPKADPLPAKTDEPLAPRGEQLNGTTYKLKWPESAHAVYVTINDVEQDGLRRPFEMFINSKNMEHYAWTLGLTRMISAVFRRSADVAFVAEELKAVFDPRGGAWIQGRYVPSLLAAIGDIVDRHLNDLGAGMIAPQLATFAHPFTPAACPQCGATKLVKVEGCNNCLDCGYSKCG